MARNCFNIHFLYKEKRLYVYKKAMIYTRMLSYIKLYDIVFNSGQLEEQRFAKLASPSKRARITAIKSVHRQR